MYHHIKGTLIQKYPAEAVIEANGVGYQISISLNTFEKLPEAGNQAKLLTYLHVKEDVLQLFGFSDDKERKVFKILIGISGIGPKLALTLLSHMAPCDLEQAVANQDMTMLTCDLRDRQEDGRAAAGGAEGQDRRGGGGWSADASKDRGQGPSDPVIEALMTLGLNFAEAKSALDRAKAKLGDSIPVEQLIREALKGK